MSYREKNHWGNYLWAYIHTITIVDFENNENYNKNIKKSLLTLQTPCHHCNKFYNEYLEKLDTLDLTKSMVLFYWSVDLHNQVNKKLNKPEFSYEEALNKWCKKI